MQHIGFDPAKRHCAGSHRVVGALAAAVALLGCGNGKPKLPPGTVCLPDEVVALVLRADPTTVRLDGVNPSQVTLSVTPVFAGGVSAPVPLTGTEHYSLDVTSDGSFEIEFSGRTTTLVLDQPGTFPMQVQSRRCNAETVLGRVQVAAFASKPPLLDVKLAPNIVQGLLIGSAVNMTITASDPDGGSAFTVWWTWGDAPAQTRAGHSFATEGPVADLHTFATRGRFDISVAVTDAQGDTTTFRREAFITTALLDMLNVIPGAFVAAVDVRVATDTTAAAGDFAMAAGRAGVLLYRANATDAVLQSRFLLQPEGNVEALAVALDPVHRMVYGGGGEDGLYFWDVTNMARPRPMFPFVFFPTVGAGGEALYNLDRVWTCRDGRWIWVRDSTRGVFWLELTAPSLLELYRGNDPGIGAPNPYVERKRGPQGAVQAFAGGAVDDLFCVGDRFVGIAVDNEFRVMDLKPYLDTLGQATPADPVFTSIAVPTQAPDVGVKSLGVAGVAATDVTNQIVWNVALGEHGMAEYVMTYSDAGIDSLTLREHFYVFRQTLAPARIYNLVGDLLRDGPWLFMPAFDFGVLDSLFAFDRRLRPTLFGTKRFYRFTDNKCTYVTSSNFGTTSGDQADPLTDMTDCWIATPALQLLDGGRQHLWLSGVDQTKTFVQRIEPEANKVGARHRLPQTYSAVVPAGSRFVWLVQGGRVEVYDLQAFAPLVTDAIQPGPAFVRDVGTLIKNVHPTQDPASILVSNDSRVLWLSPATNGDVVVLATLERDAFLEDAALRSDAAALAVIGADGLRVETYQAAETTFTFVGSTAVGGYQRVIGCGDTFFAWRRAGDEHVVERIAVGGAVQEWGRLLAVEQFQIACSAQHLITLGEAASADRLHVRGYPLAASAAPVWQFDLPYVNGSKPDVVTVRVVGSRMLVHFRANFGGAFVYDIGVQPPEFVAADLGSIVAGLAGVNVRLVNGALWLAGINDSSTFGTRAIIKAVNE